MARTGLIVGKFCPLHKGHEHLIQTAQAQCDVLYIISYTDPEFPGCEPARRQNWLQETAPTANILVLDAGDHIPANDADDLLHRQFCAQVWQSRLGIKPDIIFSSENYGDGFAAYLSDYFDQPVKHVCVDQERRHVPISATQIRQDIHAHREYLPAHVYADFVKTVCFLGAESTGKSTLSGILATHFRTAHVEEYGRTLWEEKNGQLEFDDYLHIAQTHLSLEDAARRSAYRFLFVDTSPLTTLFYSQQYCGRADPELVRLADPAYDYVFLCHPDFPLVQDGWREDDDFRQAQHRWYEQELARRHITYTDLTGSLQDRIATVKRVID